MPKQAQEPSQGSSSVLKKKNSSFLLEKSFFWVQTGTGGQPGVQVGLKTAHFWM